MVKLAFLVGFFSTLASAMWSYNDRASFNMLASIGTVLAVITAACWYTVVYSAETKAKIIVYSLYWDAMVLGCFMFVPLILLGIYPSRNETIGILLILLGIVVTKI